MPDKCPYCGAQHYDEVERDLAKLARMQPVVDALSAYISDLRGEIIGAELRWGVVYDAWEKYEEDE